MAKNPEAAKYASDLTRAIDSIRYANEELIKLSQRFGRMIPKMQKMESPAGILSWFSLYNKVKDSAHKADECLQQMLSSEEATANPMIASQLAYYSAQRSRYHYKVEVLDDVLNGMVEDLLDSGTFDQSQSEEVRVALDETVGRSRRCAELCPAIAA
jgi:hypothetical protein